MKTQLISCERIKEEYPVKNLDNCFITPAIQISQDQYLQEIIGSSLLNEIVRQIEEEDIEERILVLLDGYIQDYLVYESLAEVVPIVHYKLRNAGVVSNYGEHIQTVSHNDSDILQKHYRTRANFYGERLRDYLNTNYSLYPEYTNCKEGEIKPRQQYPTSI